jgi:superfamily II DNA or RNA helicase
MEPRLVFPQAIIVVRTKKDAVKVAESLGPNATYIISGKDGKKNILKFTQGEKQIAVVCGMLREGYDNPNVTLCVILMHCQSRVFFEQFCGRCMRMNRTLTGKHPDKTKGTVLSYPQYQQEKMWEAREYIANEDPEEEDNDLGEVLDLSTR